MIRVLIVDNDITTRKKYSSVLNRQPDMLVLDRCTTIRQAESRIATADIILAGMKLARDGAYWLTRTVLGCHHSARILVVGHSAPKRTILRYIEAGAHGFIRIDDPEEDLAERVRKAVQGDVVLSPDLVSEVAARLVELSRYIEGASPVQNQLACLTAREREVLNLISLTYSNQEIADHLIIELGTVKNHVHNILSKLGVSSRREAARFVLSNTENRRVSANQPIQTWLPSQTMIFDQR